MKNLYRNMMLVAAAAMSFASCSEDATEEIAAPALKTKTITVIADITRTELDASRKELNWSDSDQFGVFTDIDTDKNIASGKFSEAVDGALSFEVNAAATAIYAYYPYYYGNKSAENTAVNFGIPASQTWNGPGILYGNNLPMAASGTIEGSSVKDFSFKKLGCVLALNVYGGVAGETLSSITLTTTEPSCGRVDMDITKNPVVYTPTENTVTLSPYNNAAAIAVDAAAVENKQTYANQVYLVVAKKVYPEGARFVVSTSETTYTFTTKAAIDCTTSDFKAINLNLKKGVKPEPLVGEWKQVTALSDITEGIYVVVNDGYYLPSTTTSSAAPVKKSLADAKVTVENGTLTGTITETMKWYFTGTNNAISIKNSAGDYLYAEDKGDGVRVGNTSDTWAFETNGAGFAAKGTKGRYVATRESNNDWRSYKDKNYNTYGDKGILYLYKFVSDSEPQPTEPAIAVNPIAEVAAVGVTNEVSTNAYEVRNSTSAAVVKSVDGTVVTSATIESDGLHYTVAPNYSGAARTGSITLELADNAAVSAAIEVSQLADVFEVAETVTCGNAAGEEGKVSIKVTSSYPWTITNNNTTYTVSPDTYDGSHTTGITEITVTPTAANETAEAVTLGSFTITRTTGDTDTNKTKQVEVKQNGIPSEPDVTIVASELGYDNGDAIPTTGFSRGNITFAYTGSVKYYTSGGLRCYNKSTFTISSVDGQKIAKIIFDPLYEDNTNNKLTVNTGEWNENIISKNGTGTWTGSANSVTFTVGGTKGHVRIGAIKVYYE